MYLYLTLKLIIFPGNSSGVNCSINMTNSNLDILIYNTAWVALLGQLEVRTSWSGSKLLTLSALNRQNALTHLDLNLRGILLKMFYFSDHLIAILVN